MSIPQITIIDVVRLKRKDFSCKTENKSCYVLTCRIEGESLFFYNQEEHYVKRGDILYIPYRSSYSQKCESETLICFHLNIVGQISSSIEIVSPENRDKICDLFVRAEELWRRKSSNYEFSCMSILYEIISYTEISVDKQSRHSEEVLKPAMAYLCTHLCDMDLSLAQVCKEAHISRTYFNKLFYQVYGCTPTAYVNEQRIERAKNLLISGCFSNEEIASLCGFNDVKYFYVLFKKLTGFTTKGYKKGFECQNKNCFASGVGGEVTT